MKVLIITSVLLIVFLGSCVFFRSDPKPSCDVEKIIQSFTSTYNEGQITEPSYLFTDDFQWFSDTEYVNGEQVNHFAGQTYEELLTHYQSQYELGQRIHITEIDINGVDSWHGNVDFGYKGVSETSDGMGVLLGKGVVDCQAEKIAVWSMATHYPEVMPIQ